MRRSRPLFLFSRVIALTCAILLCLPLAACRYGDEDPLAEPKGESEETYTGKIRFDSRRYTFEGDGAAISVQNDAILIQKEGIYLLTGKLTEGRIVTDAPAVRLVLDGAELCSSASSVIESRRGTLMIESREGSVNILRSEGAAPGAIETDGDIFVIGKGKTVISAPSTTYALTCGRFFGEGGDISLTAKNGILCRVAEINGGRVSLRGTAMGIYAEDSIRMTGGALVALCDETALCAENEIILTGGERDVRAPKPYVCKKEENSKK